MSSEALTPNPDFPGHSSSTEKYGEEEEK